MRQIEVVRLLAEGLKMTEVGEILGVSKRTIAYHKYRIMGMLGIRRNAELIRYAVKNRII